MTSEQPVQARLVRYLGLLEIEIHADVLLVQRVEAVTRGAPRPPLHLHMLACLTLGACQVLSALETIWLLSLWPKLLRVPWQPGALPGWYLRWATKDTVAQMWMECRTASTRLHSDHGHLKTKLRRHCRPCSEQRSGHRAPRLAPLLLLRAGVVAGVVVLLTWWLP